MSSARRPSPVSVIVSPEPLPSNAAQLVLGVVPMFYRPPDGPLSIKADHVLAWRDGLLYLQPLQPAVGGMPVSYYGVLDQAGRNVFAESLMTDAGTPRKPTASLEGTSLRRIELRTGRESTVGYARQLGGPAQLTAALSPDGAATAILESFREAAPGRTNGLSLVRLSLIRDGGAPRVVQTLEARGFGSHTDDLPLQWSPSGQALAVTAHLEGDTWPSLQVLDLSTRTSAKYDGFVLAGSMSWSPDGEQLLVASAWSDRPHVLRVSSGDIDPVGVLPDRPEEGSGPRPYGFLTDEQILVGRGRTGRFRASAMNLATGAEVPLFRWIAEPYPLPTFARDALLAWLTETGRLGG